MKILNIEQGSDFWLEERWTCVTGTRMESAVGATFDKKTNSWRLAELAMGKQKQQTLLFDLVSEMQSNMEIDDFTSAAMQRGHDLEPLSVEAAGKKMGVKFETVGMLAHDTIENFKFSPDAVYMENGVVVGGFETKSKAGKTHIEYMLANEIPREHFWQCLAPMVMDDCVQWWAFGHYDDRNRVNPLFLTVIKREDYAELIEEARIVLKEFLAEVKRVNDEMTGGVL